MTHTYTKGERVLIRKMVRSSDPKTGRQLYKETSIKGTVLDVHVDSIGVEYDTGGRGAHRIGDVQRDVWPLLEVHTEDVGMFDDLEIAKCEILYHFNYSHLPPRLQTVSKQFYKLARFVHDATPSSAERTVALRKLLEGKDAAVRAANYKAPT